MVCVALIVRKFPMTKELFNRVKEALERRRAGEEIDIDIYRDIRVELKYDRQMNKKRRSAGSLWASGSLIYGENHRQFILRSGMDSLTK